MPEQIVVNNEEPRIAIIDNKKAENFADINQTQLYLLEFFVSCTITHLIQTQ